MDMNLNMFGVFAFGFNVISRVFYGVLVGVMCVWVTGGLLGFLGYLWGFP